jgi:hypothetical protein
MERENQDFQVSLAMADGVCGARKQIPLLRCGVTTMKNRQQQG